MEDQHVMSKKQRLWPDIEMVDKATDDKGIWGDTQKALSDNQPGHSVVLWIAMGKVVHNTAGKAPQPPRVKGDECRNEIGHMVGARSACCGPSGGAA